MSDFSIFINWKALLIWKTASLRQKNYMINKSLTIPSCRSSISAWKKKPGCLNWNKDSLSEFLEFCIFFFTRMQLYRILLDTKVRVRSFNLNYITRCRMWTKVFARWRRPFCLSKHLPVIKSIFVLFGLHKKN